MVEEREPRYRVDALLARLMDNIPMLARPADTPAPAEATPTPGQGTTGYTAEPRSSDKPWWRRVFGL